MRIAVGIHLTKSERTTPSGMTIRETRSIDPEKSRVQKRIEFTIEGKPREIHESVRFYEAEEICLMAKKAGLALKSSFGDFDGSPLTPDSPRAIYIFQVQPLAAPPDEEEDQRHHRRAEDREDREGIARLAVPRDQEQRERPEEPDQATDADEQVERSETTPCERPPGSAVLERSAWLLRGLHRHYSQRWSGPSGSIASTHPARAEGNASA